MSEITYTCGDQVVSSYQLQARADIERGRAPKKAANSSLKRVELERDAKECRGFNVLGYAPGVMDSVSVLYGETLKAFREGKEGVKDPGTQEEFVRSWRNKNKPKRVSRTLHLESAADECAKLAEKAGWTDVRVDALYFG